ncbi:amidase domain-containing protein [Paenibacillus athensensis]|uniref:Putative amidase domain-containing protein n=1 Tax=Paenibacillus athensensis TaxID=1967502 RepID=A0A4Y8PVE6_9BACL|nr:amidase domain-containing protein [Paenibacillus athensensis]MCD1258748.1 amidase domain-containing protein [Paenibacillus athensensis]
MSWKTALYHYVYAKNQAELEGRAEPMAPYVADAGFLRDQQQRLARLADSLRERGARPLRCETKLRLAGVKESGGGIVADIELRRSLLYRIGTVEHTEERAEPERLTLREEDGRWRIRGLESRLSERQTPPGGRAGIFPPFAEPALRSPSLPYINYSILNTGEPPSRNPGYNRAKAVAYAERWWNSANPAYLTFEVDCTNYVSQCLFAGKGAMDYTGKREAGWWYAGKQGGQELWSYSWAVAHSLQAYAVGRRSIFHGEAVERPEMLVPGDIISYDWDGDGRYQHNAIVTALDAGGMPLVNAHTYNSRARYWEYRDSPAWTERTRYAFVRIADE